MQLNVRELGDRSGAPTVCIHGLTGFGGRFRGLAERHLPERRLLAVDLRGHGLSGWEPPWDMDTHVADLLETARAAGIDRATWIGHSVGGRLIAHLAAAAPEAVERAVLLDPAMHVDPAIAAERVELARGDTSFATADEAIDARVSDPTLFRTPRETVAAESAEHLYQGDDGRFRWRFHPGMAIVAWSEMATAAPPWPACPTLMVVGERSWIPLDASGAPQVTTVVVPGGHSVLWDAPEETGAAVAAFLAA